MTPTDRQPGHEPVGGQLAWRLALAFGLLLGVTPRAMAQPASIEVYGFAMLDMGLNLKTINPNWFDTMRVTGCRRPTVSSARTTARSPAYARAGWA